MKKASQVMYIIGRIFNLVEIISFVIMIVSGVILLVGSASITDEAGQAAAIATGSSLVAVGVIFFIIALVVGIILFKAYKAVSNETHEKKPHIVMIVLGAISENVFLVLGGIFGLIAG